MEIENTSTFGNYSQNFYFRSHKYAGTNGRCIPIAENGFIGFNADSPECMLHIRDSGGGLYTDLQKAIILGADGAYTTTGLNIGNHDTRPFLWCGNNGTSIVNATTFTHRFGFLYMTSGNLQLMRKNGPGQVSVIVYNRTNGCVTFTNNSPGCGSDDRLKFNEKNITNALKTIMKLSPEIYVKITAPNNDDDDKEYEEGDEISEFDIDNSHKESGFIAQEVEEIPELKHLVYTDNDGYKLKSINYFGIIPYNTKAIQELKLENDKLKGRINSLESELSLIKSHLGL